MYLIAGTDAAKIDAALARLRARAEAEGGPGSLEDYSPASGSSAGPDADALLAAIPANTPLGQPSTRLIDFCAEEPSKHSLSDGSCALPLSTSSQVGVEPMSLIAITITAEANASASASTTASARQPPLGFWSVLAGGGGGGGGCAGSPAGVGVPLASMFRVPF